MAKNKSQYDSTLNLPKTLFEMRAGLPKKEPVMLKDWDDNDLYNQLMKHNEGKPQFILHDGPPYANGNIHMGTALNKIIKDIIIREKNMEGFQAPYVPGFDTHGLPIELKALSSVGEKKKDISKLELRQICEKFATEHIDIMSDQFKRLGVIGDFEHPYLTLKPEFEARQIEIFGEMAKKGYIYKGLKPVYWCPDCRTALAEAEIEYGEDECDSIFVRFHVSQDPNGVLAKHGIPMEKTYFVIWTTTTWTLPANEAICLNGQFEYSFVKIGDEFHIMATDLVKSVMDSCHITDYEVVGEPVSGAEFELMRYNHVYLPKEGWVILGDHVTLESGSGCVHTAGGHGVDDFNVCQKYPQIPITVPVDDGGYLTEQAGKYAGQRVWASNKTILADLTAAGAVMGQLHIKHQYPHCWRCHNPIIFRATEQWFCSIAKFREDVYKAIDTVTWMPDWGHDRMHGMVRDRTTGASAVSAPGVCLFRPSTARSAVLTTSPTPPSRPSATCSARRALTPGISTTRSRSSPLVRSARSAALPSGRRTPTSWTSGSTPAPPMLPFWKSVPSCASRPICIWRAATSSAAGSSPAC